MFHLSSTDIAIYIFAYILVVVWLALFLIHICAIIYTSRRLYWKHNLSDLQENHSLPGISVIKPLTGVDGKLRINLTSYFTMNYPRYELLFCVASEDDPAVPLVRELCERFPDVDVQILTKADKVGVNNKINNMNQAYRVAKYDRVLISDAGIFMREDTLLDMVVTMEARDDIGMVHQVPFLQPDANPTFSRVFQHVYFGTWHAKMYMGAAFFGINCTTGMSCLMRKSVLDVAGGLSAFSCYLAEDFFFSKYFYDHNWRVVISGQPAWQNGPWGTLRQFQDRLMRWHQLRIAMTPLTTVFEPMTECFPIGFCAAFAANFIFPSLVNWAVFFLCHVLVWFLLDYILLLRMHPRGEPLGFSRFEFLTVWLFRESTSYFFQLRATSRRQVEWRHKRYMLRWGGVTVELPDAKQQVTKT